MEKRKPGRPSNTSNRRTEILEKASWCFALKGYDETSLDEIGDSLGFNKSALYYYFKNKEDLFSQVLNYERYRLWEIAKAETEAVEGLENKILKYFTVRSEMSMVQIKINELSRFNILDLNTTYTDATATFREQETDYLLNLLSQANTGHTKTEIIDFIMMLTRVQSSITMTAILLKDLENNLSIVPQLRLKKEKILKHLLNSFYSEYPAK